MADASAKDIAYRALASVIGGPVDIAQMLMRPFGYSTPENQVVGGSEWIGQKMQDAGIVGTARSPVAEFVASLPIGAPTAAVKMIGAGAAGIGGIAGLLAAGIKGASVPSRMGQSGAIAYHGSPHKFDKFLMDKIGTGEGAQAYGHGLYLAESPAVAKEYAQKLSSAGLARNTLAQSSGDMDAAISAAEKSVDGYRALIAQGGGGDARRAQGMLTLAEKKLADLRNMKSGTLDEAGSLYKTDIPDEAVARFLDWDKPLSEQAEAMKALKAAGYGRTDTPDIPGSYYAPKDNEEIRALLDAGIPGIRYLDGGSRGYHVDLMLKDKLYASSKFSSKSAADQYAAEKAAEGFTPKIELRGTSNFVVFDPEMIRILERNGQPTGLQPWLPAEWKGLR